MPAKKPQDRKPKKPSQATVLEDDRFDVEGRKFVWHGLDDDDQRTVDVTLPLRLKLGLMRRAKGLQENLNADEMFAILELVAPGQQDAIDELDINDFIAMFTTWQAVYNDQNGATLGEAERSPA